MRELIEDPDLMQRALALLDAWEHFGGAENPLRMQWREIIAAQDWNLALEESERGDTLRGASPLGGSLLTLNERNAIMEHFRARWRAEAGMLSGSPARAGAESPGR